RPPHVQSPCHAVAFTQRHFSVAFTHQDRVTWYGVALQTYHSRSRDPAHRTPGQSGYLELDLAAPGCGYARHVGSFAGRLERPAPSGRVVSHHAAWAAASRCRSARPAAGSAVRVPAGGRQSAPHLERRRATERRRPPTARLGRSLRRVPQLPRPPGDRRPAADHGVPALQRRVPRDLERRVSLSFHSLYSLLTCRMQPLGSFPRLTT